MNYQFLFLDFEPTTSLKRASKSLLSDVLEHSPSDATSLARLAKRERGFEATIEIFSQAGHFVGHAFEKSAERALLAVKQKIEDRLSRWKKLRFFDSVDTFSTFPLIKGQPGGTYGTHPF